ncbi:putative protocadherin beta-18 [Octopus vulgaris]|uniref:Protocadherin beta-18 n=1 Tax=Octopus vulgaris TaxID=6645 RepID=A0AA36FB04_OCTVU|nr:putative protocadherin beta-18 [Octopus vulgaris]
MFITNEFQFGKMYKITVEARDCGKIPMSSTAIVLVNGVTHRNNPPNIDVMFLLKTTGNTILISEAIRAGRYVAYVKVIDNDSGENGQVKCHLQNRYLQLISVSAEKYKVVVKSEIDRESEKSFNFTIKCQDNGLPPLKVEKQFSVLVTDINDVQPQFSQDIFKFLTYENEHKDFPVGYVNATDPDIGDGGQLTYSLLSNGKDILPFQISDVGFISTTESLDREEKNLYEFKVLVKDKGTPSLEKRANVVVEVMDLNDNAPYFSFPNVDPFSLNVHYHPHSDHDITVVRASDRDSQHNAFLTYEILRGNEKHLFQMNHHSGVLSFSRSLYQNDAGFYELELGVKDSGSPVLSSTTTLSLTLTVSNSTSKIFKTPSKTTTESSNGLQLNVMIVIVIAAVIVSVVIVISISTCIVHRLKQTDNNYNNSVDMYHKVTPALNIQSKYIFDPTCVPPGVQYTLERNLKPSQESKVYREDTYCRTIPSDKWNKFTLNRPEQCPEHHDDPLDLYFQMFIPREETMSPGYRELNNTDQLSEMSKLSHTDSGHGWSVGSAGHYEELPDLCRYQSDQTWKRRNQLQNTLNRSRGDNKYGYQHHPNVDNNTSCSIDQTPLTITGTTSNITDQHSTAPVKNLKTVAMLYIVLLVLLMVDNSWCVDHTYHVKENNDINSFIGDIVSDAHLLHDIQSQDDSNKLTFNILQGGNDGDVQLFNVTPGGQIYTAAILDAEILCQYDVECFRILEIAVQHDHSFLKIIEIKVIIEDVNDNSPKFPNEEFHLKFDENDLIGTKYIIPNAIDNDVSIQNSRITYEIEDLNTPFKLIVSKELDGSDLLQLNLENVLDRETKSIYEIQLIARDNGSPQKKGVLRIKILVKDINDNKPLFSQKNYNITVNDTHQLNKPIAKLLATDLDEGENGLISYFFNAITSKYTERFFRLDELTGYLFLKKEFQFGRIYKLYVEASDNGNPPMSSAATVLVTGISHLNNSPKIDVKFVIESTGNTAVISEASKIGSFVAYVKITDSDGGKNGQVNCHLHNKYLQLILISEKKYKVVVKSEIDRESEKSFNFTIKCQDNGSPPLTVEKQFSMLVTDINDVQPQFSQDIFKFLTYENEHKDFPVGYVNATDPDIGDGGQLTYSLLSDGKDILPFQISDVGFISTTESLDREEKNLYEFKVLVKDKGTPSLEKRANVVVEVMDLNDNAPYFSFPNVDPFSLNVHYHPHSDHDITVVRASDRDSQHNAFLTYEILRGNEKHLFQMNHHSGVLSFSRSLYQNDAGYYELELGVKDSGSPVLSSTTTLSLTLTVSNNTSKIFKTPSKTTTESSNGLQLNVMIVIVVAAVIVSVVIVISISICIVHRLKQTDNNYNNSVDMYHKVTPALNIQSKYIFDPTCVPPGVQCTMERNLKKPQQPIEDRENIYCRTMSADRWDDLTSRKQLMFIPREESIPPGYRELNGADQFSEMSTLSSHTDSGHGWSVGSAGHYEELPDLCRYQCDRTWNRRNPNFSNTLNRSRGDNHNGYHYQPNVDINTSCDHDQIPFTVTGTTSDISEQPSTVPMTSDFSSDCKPPLPPVPKVTTLPKNTQIEQLHQYKQLTTDGVGRRKLRVQHLFDILHYCYPHTISVANITED